MQKTETPPRIRVASFTTNNTVLILALVLLTLLIVGSGITLLSAQMSLTRTQQNIVELDSQTTDLSRLGQMSDISNNGGMASANITTKTRQMLQEMNKGKCCTLQSDFALSSLDYLGHTSTVLAGDKTQIVDMEFAGDISKGVQADVIAAYNQHENLVKRFIELIINWNSVFGSERDQRLKDADDAISALEPVYAQTQTKIDQIIADQRTKQSSVAMQRQQLETSLPNWQTQTTLAIAGIILGIMLFGGLLLMLGRSRRHFQTAGSATGDASNDRKTDSKHARSRKNGKRK